MVTEADVRFYVTLVGLCAFAAGFFFGLIAGEVHRKREKGRENEVPNADDQEERG